MILSRFFNQRLKNKTLDNAEDNTYEFCPRCDANLTLQKGYQPNMPYWVCKGCGEMLINPEVPDDSGIAWICDKCEAMLNIQPGFESNSGEWACTECGHVNRISDSDIYNTDDEYRQHLKNPYRGLSDEDALALSCYQEIGAIGNRPNVYLVKDIETEKLYVKKVLSTYDKSVYDYIRANPISHMPCIVGVYEGNNSLIIIEEYIDGKTLDDILKDDKIDASKAVNIVRQLVLILERLHSLKTPIIHRDIKPSNVIIKSEDEVYLLDMNVAKWYNATEAEDTRLLGTQYYAAPEQMGFGFNSSTEKTDIYAVGVLLNVMVTGKYPKEEKAPEPIWKVVEKCIALNPEDRYTDRELVLELEGILR